MRTSDNMNIYVSQDICAVSFPVQFFMIDRSSLFIFLIVGKEQMERKNRRKGTDEKGIIRSIRTKCSCKPLIYNWLWDRKYNICTTAHLEVKHKLRS